MPITFHPKPGQVLMCDFNTGFRPPEMVKKRLVVVVSRKNRELATIVPLSSTAPMPVEPCHHEMQDASLPLSFRGRRTWAKCDMLTTVGYWRLDRVQIGKHPTTGNRMYVSQVVSPEDLAGIRRAILHVLGLGGLTSAAG
ncbi:MAG: hypothetical protein GXX96_24915 [Planctomycetaceae bacterium]|jgi:uncharacterized protein YifN (PemK superfamily)|nr:hypothetical protein [Planctomycetaceae bacterium]